MNTPAIILGDPNGVLRPPKAVLRNPGDWTQLDSDILAHLIQVQKQIQQSRWNKANVRFTTQIIYRDYSHWLHDYRLLLADTRWHDRLFEIKPQAEQHAPADGGRDLRS